LKKILITGATGFIGGHLLKKLVNTDNEIIVTGRNHKRLDLLSKNLDSIKVLPGDLSDSNFVKKILSSEYDEIYHLAGYKFVNLSEKNVLESINSNLISTIRILENISRCNSNVKLSLVSSDKTAQVKGVYSATKFLNEKLVEEFKKFIPEVYNLKLSNVFCSPGSVGEIWKTNILKNEPIKVSDYSSTRFFSNVDDVINSLINPNINLKIKSLEMKTLIKAIISKYNKNYKINMIQLTGLGPYENLHEFNKNANYSSADYTKYSLEETINLI
jgi:FlaA1/EpsC-like NDP-sugar epimerase